MVIYKLDSLYIGILVQIIYSDYLCSFETAFYTKTPQRKTPNNALNLM